jgi:O-antigen/teichoic acid export membrane protein
MVFLYQKFPDPGRIAVGGLLFVAWSFAEAFITFGKGHGKDEGPVYLQVWSSFFLSLDIMNSQIAILLRKQYASVRVEERQVQFGNGSGQ